MDETIKEIFGLPFFSELCEQNAIPDFHNNDDGVRPSKTPRKDMHITSQGTLLKIKDLMVKKLNETGESLPKEIHQEGRLGPKIVKLDVGSHVGSFIISNDRLGVNSQCNFGSVRANTCIYRGKWQYEVQLGSKGVMQLGWATISTKFSQEKGVGDTADSYAYDGNRLRKWNEVTAPYGETWQTGDIIGCCIDADAGTIEFLRNGNSMGKAFTHIRLGPGIAYFPAASLGFGENMTSNFGATPLQFPVPNYSPLQLQQNSEYAKADLLLQWLRKALPIDDMIMTNCIVELLGPTLHSGFVVERSFLPFFAELIGLPPRISHDVDISLKDVHFDAASSLLRAMWTYLEENEMKNCLEKLSNILVNLFRSNTLSVAYSFQHFSLKCLLALTGHRKTRRHLIRQLIFDKSNRLMNFLHVRPLDDAVLQGIVKESWWEGKGTPSPTFQSACAVIHEHVGRLEKVQVQLLKRLLTNSDGTDKRPSSRAIFLRKLRVHIRDVIRPGSMLQQPGSRSMSTFFRLLETIKELQMEELGEDDLPVVPPSVFYDTSITYFDMERVGGLSSYLYKTHHLEVSSALRIPDYMPVTPLDNPAEHGNLMTDHFEIQARPVPFSSSSQQLQTEARQRFQAQQQQLQQEQQAAIQQLEQQALRTIEIPDEDLESVSATSSGEVSLPVAALIAETASGHNMLIPMLTDFRTLMAPGEHGLTTYYPTGFVGFSNVTHQVVIPKNPAVILLGKERGAMEARASLRELLDGAIIIYNSGVLRHVEKVVSLRNTMEEYATAIEKAKENLHSTTISNDERTEIQKSINIFMGKLEEQSRHYAWVCGAIFTKERQSLIFSLLNSVLTTLQEASLTGVLFTFLPEIYVSTAINLTWLLLNQFHPTIPFDTIKNIGRTLVNVAQFVATHFADPRIIVAETKDTLTQSLSMFICNRSMLTALEQMPDSSKIRMVKSILRPYENRAWAQSNWMLVRMWQGNGFGFQYPNSAQARRSFRAKPVQDEFGISTNLPPTPSAELQSYVTKVLVEYEKFAGSYVHSVLNQLNWAFSEFVGLLQEIQNAAVRPERVFIESRQLKICCTCYELTQALLRVLEMIINIAPVVLTDFKRDSAESLLGRLCMLLSQIMNRIGSNTGSFAQVVRLDIAGLENVTYYPILAAVAGIFVAICRNDIGKSNESEVPVTKMILAEPSFIVTSLDYLIGQGTSAAANYFSLRNHVPDDVSEEEIRNLEATIEHLAAWSQRIGSETLSIADDDACTICYAYKKNTTFYPCHHRACKTCIIHHLMNRGECFFCKATILKVICDDDGKVIHDSSENDGSPSKSTALE